MRTKQLFAAIVLTAVLIVSGLPACSTVKAADSYTAIVPAVLATGTQQAVSVALFVAGKPVPGKVEVTLLKENQQVLQVTRNIKGKEALSFKVPDIAEGEYRLRVRGQGFEDEARVRIEKSFLTFLETDKPIYKPGQTIHIRALTLDSDLRPSSENVTVEVLDAKGIKIFRRSVVTDDYGMATLDLPLSTEPNLGTWKLTGVTAKGKTQLDVRVEEYVLPKYEIKVELPKDWFLVSEPVKGKVVADYSFGKPVKGELEIKATRYVGRWQEYATVKTPIDGSAEFTIPAAGYVAGVPAAGGMGNVRLSVTVEEKATGYRENTDRLLTIAQSALNIKIVPSGSVFKPGLPFSFMVITQTPDNKLVDTRVKAVVTYLNKEFRQINPTEVRDVLSVDGKALVVINPPADSVALMINCTADRASASKNIEAGYSPSGNFIHLEQMSGGIPKIGEEMRFKVNSTREAANFYYEVVSRGRVVFTDFTKSNQITLRTTPQMAPSAKLLVYQILPNSEVAADYLPFAVTADYPQKVRVGLSAPEARPGDEVTINIETEEASRVGLAAVDRSVFILAENRLNLQQVFAELERLYMKPQAELHEVSLIQGILNRGAKEIFRDAGVVVLSNNTIPEGKEYKRPMGGGAGAPRLPVAAEGKVVAPMATPAPKPAPAPSIAVAGLMEVQRVRQYFPETWLWQNLVTDARGRASLKVTVPDSITTWMLRAVAMSKNKGLGIGEAQLKAFQPFFLSVDLPYSAIRGEEFPVKVAVYNYLNQTQGVLVQIQREDWFDLLDSAEKTVQIAANDTGGAEFKIRPRKLGTSGVKISARSTQAADAAIRTIIIEPEGVAKELVDNLALSSGSTRELSTTVPRVAIDGSGRAYLAVTASYLTQTIEGLEKLLQMPFGCGEQNMLVFAPDVFITRYLKESGQLKPEIMAKAEKLMITGYQRQLTYRRNDGSFSAFGQSDKEGSLWLTAFVMKSFAQAKDLIYIDDTVLDRARGWITSRQKADGSFDPIGFVHHQEMLGGLKGKTALTAYVAVALMQVGDRTGSARAIAYLETKLDEIDDAYAMALVSYALELGKSARSANAYDKLMKMAKQDDNGLYWGGGIGGPEPLPRAGIAPMPPMPRSRTADIETTAYATLALLQHRDVPNASRAARWLVSKRNAYGGYGSTQDTVVALQALTEFSGGSRADVDLTVTVETGGKTRELRLRQDNYDVLQIIDVPVNDTVRVSARGKGEAIGQLVRRFNLPEAGKETEILQVDVDYDATQVAVNDLVKVSVALSFNPPVPMEAGMTVLDISVPTGFAPVTESIASLIQKEKKIKRYDIAGRKVIFYVENMLPGDKLAFSFTVKALYPVKAKGVTSLAYSYYKPEIASETLGRDITVVER